jgi:hypothetical protein
MWQYRSLLIEFLHHRYAPMIVFPQCVRVGKQGPILATTASGKCVRLSAAGANTGNRRER